jgi:8-oxo-dGTP pyrophosphatase MutT (NUDIX family)
MTGAAPDRPYLMPAGPLAAADAAAALIVDEHGRYLVQLRDAKPTIFFPDHWGCFGGALEPGESYADGLRRELEEELGLEIGDAPLRPFTHFTFDLAVMGQGAIGRSYFEVRVAASALSRLTLSEGREMRFFRGAALLQERVVPYDRFAIWMHCYRETLAGA